MTEQQFTEIFPKASSRCFEPLVKYMKEYEIKGEHELHFLATLAHESGGLTVWQENLNYSAKRLLEIFPKYFNVTTAGEYAYQPQKIANYVYGNRLGNGPASSGDGFRYSGKGPIQITGKSNYIAVGKGIDVNLVNNPEWLLGVDIGIKASCWWYKNNVIDRMKI